MSTVKKPDANPIAAALLTWLVFGIGHVVINGQTNKWIWVLVTTFIGSLACLLPGMVIAILSIIDAYQTAERLKGGEEIPEGEFTNPMLFKVCKILYKDATCKNA